MCCGLWCLVYSSGTSGHSPSYMAAVLVYSIRKTCCAVVFCVIGCVSTTRVLFSQCFHIVPLLYTKSVYTWCTRPVQYVPCVTFDTSRICSMGIGCTGWRVVGWEKIRQHTTYWYYTVGYVFVLELQSIRGPYIIYLGTWYTDSNCCTTGGISYLSIILILVVHISGT